MVFVNGVYSDRMSTIRSSELTVLDLDEAAKNEYRPLVEEHLGHSSKYIKDGIHALNTAFLQEGVFVKVKKGAVVEHQRRMIGLGDPSGRFF